MPGGSRWALFAATLFSRSKVRAPDWAATLPTQDGVSFTRPLPEARTLDRPTEYEGALNGGFGPL